MKSTNRIKKDGLFPLIVSTVALITVWSGEYWSISSSLSQDNRFFDADRSNLAAGRKVDFNRDADSERQTGTLERLGSLPGLSGAAEEKTKTTFGRFQPSLHSLQNQSTGLGEFGPTVTTELSSLNSQNPYRLTARIHLEAGTHQGYFVVQVELAKGTYIHSLFVDEALNPSKIEVRSNGVIRFLDQFESDLPPKVIEQDPVFGKRMEKHYQKVQFFAPISVEVPDQFHKNTIPVLFSGQVCSDQGMCLPIRSKKIEASFSGFFRRN